MPTAKLVPSELKYIFKRTNWQTIENKRARKLNPSIEPDGVEFETIAIHFPPDFLSMILVEQEFIRRQVVHGTRGVKRREDKSIIENSRKEKPVEVYGVPIQGTNKHDIFQQMAAIGLDLIESEKNEGMKAEMTAFVVNAKPLDRERPESKKRRENSKGDKPELVTQIQVCVTKELFERVKVFQEKNKIKNRANIFYFLCNVALASFKNN